MRKEPAEVTASGIYKLLDAELEDLNMADIKGAHQVFRLMRESADGIRDEMENILLMIQDAGEIMDAAAVPEPEKTHGQLTEIYRASIQAAGKAVRLAAAARQGIIQSEAMSAIDQACGQA